MGTELDGFFLTIGQIVPPTAAGASPEELRENILKGGPATIRPIGHFSISPARLRELRDLLGRSIEDLDQREGSR